jgi:hypothetical protein
MASRFSDAHNAFILKQGVDGMPLVDTYCGHGDKGRENLTSGGPKFGHELVGLRWPTEEDGIDA